jgi:hypothetical protein
MFDVPLPNDPATLTTLAAYFESQAARMRREAERLTQQARDGEKATQRRQESSLRHLLWGCRAAVMVMRGKTWAQAASKIGTTQEIARHAASVWNRSKARRAKDRRNRSIWKEAQLKGSSQAAIAARHGITARRVRMIVDEYEKRLRAASLPSRDSLFRRAAHDITTKANLDQVPKVRRRL